MCWSWGVCLWVSVCVQCWELSTNTKQMATQLLAAGGGNTQHGTEGVTSTSSNNTDVCTNQLYWHPATNTEKRTGPKSDSPISQSTQSTTSLEVHLLWFISASPPLFFPGPQLWRRRGDRERILFRRRQERRGTSVTLSLASSSASPAAPPPPAPLSVPVVTVAPVWTPSSGLQLHSGPWLPSGLELAGPTLAVSSVEEQETETSLVLSPPVTGSSFWRHPRNIFCHYNLKALLPGNMPL